MLLVSMSMFVRSREFRPFRKSSGARLRGELTLMRFSVEVIIVCRPSSSSVKSTSSPAFLGTCIGFENRRLKGADSMDLVSPRFISIEFVPKPFLGLDAVVGIVIASLEGFAP